jgi:hypothetical protein
MLEGMAIVGSWPRGKETVAKPRVVSGIGGAVGGYGWREASFLGRLRRRGGVMVFGSGGWVEGSLGCSGRAWKEALTPTAGHCEGRWEASFLGDYGGGMVFRSGGMKEARGARGGE